jgi:LmbE family N-acetylglucosaminyl deacetylase
MAGEATNDDAVAFWQADVDEATDRLVDVLREEAVDLLVTYDERGGYGHPDHIQVHRLGAAVARRGDGPRVLESTMNRDHLLAGMEAVSPDDVPNPEDVGMPAERIHLAIDVQAWIERKRTAMQAHASQINDESFFLKMPPELFAYAFGTEWYIRHGEPDPVGETVLGDITALLAVP